MQQPALAGWHQPFVIPNHIKPEQEKEFLLKVIDRYRSELIALRKVKNQNERLKEKLKRWKTEIEKAKQETEKNLEKLKQMEKLYEQLKEKAEKYKKQRDMYRGMIFKKNKQKTAINIKNKSKSKRGGQVGHKGYGRRKPVAGRTKRVYALCCPNCQGRLSRTESFTSHTVEDIPELLKLHTVTTEYQIERQWCSQCKKEVQAIPPGVIPHARLGINLIVTGMLLKYGTHTPINKIIFLYQNLFGIKLSEGGFVNLLYRAKSWLGPFYDEIKREVKTARVKHADETGWRIEGVNNWIWAFLSNQSVYFKVEESRGRGVPRGELEDVHEDDVLVRDDYRAYQKLKLKHQSCWAHLLRKSREAAKADSASEEVVKIHQKLKTIYWELKRITNQSLNQKKRERIHKQKWEQLQRIIQARFKQQDAIAIQTRIENQGKNLLTALLYEGVPLTNNRAERNLRPMVVMRKISGGSKSMQGAETHSVNMSILQTLKMREQPLVLALQEKILDGAIGKN